jgi:hypothetical protein
MTTQCDQILSHLKRGKTITQVDAFNEYGCWRLAARVKDLRNQGHDVLTIRESQGEKVFARYLLRTSK